MLFQYKVHHNADRLEYTQIHLKTKEYFTGFPE